MKNNGENDTVFALILFVALAAIAIPILVVAVNIFSVMAATGSFIGWVGLLFTIGMIGAGVCHIFGK